MFSLLPTNIAVSTLDINIILWIDTRTVHYSMHTIRSQMVPFLTVGHTANFLCVEVEGEALHLLVERWPADYGASVSLTWVLTSVT